MKRFAIILLALGTLIFAGIASAQRGGGGHGGGSMGGGSMGGGMHGGGGWSGGSHGGSWSGGSHGGSWSGGWHGGSGWHGGGWHGSGWHGNTVVVGFGGWWGGWWPGYYYPYYGGYGYGYPVTYPYAYPYYGYGEYAPMYDTGSYVQRPDASYPGDQQYQFQGQGGQVTSDGYSYYCPNPAGYYPQIPNCAAGWLRVVPQGAPGPNAPAQR